MFRAPGFLHLVYFLWRQDIGAGRNYSRKDCVACVLGNHVGTERRLTCRARTASNVWPWPLTSLCVNMWVQKWAGVTETKQIWPLSACLGFTFMRHVAHRCRFGSTIVFASTTKLKGLSEWFHSAFGSWDRESKTAHSHLISAQPFPRPNTAGALGKWERNITFPFRRRGMWHSVDGFCRIGSPKARLSFFFWSRNVG